MSFPRSLLIALVSAGVLTTVVRAQPQERPRQQACFFSRDFQQWRAPDPNTILIRVGLSRFYRLDLATSCRSLMFPDVHLVTVFHGGDSICAPIDWDIRVSQYPVGITEQCVVRSMTRMTPGEVASIPQHFRP